MRRRGFFGCLAALVVAPIEPPPLHGRRILHNSRASAPENRILTGVGDIELVPGTSVELRYQNGRWELLN